MISHGMIHIIPRIAIAAKVIFHSNARYNAAITGAATTDPSDAPAPKIPCAIALSFDGNHSAFDLVAPGQLPASKNPNMERKMLNDVIDFAKACNAIEILHPTIDTTNPNRVP